MARVRKALEPNGNVMRLPGAVVRTRRMRSSTKAWKALALYDAGKRLRWVVA